MMYFREGIGSHPIYAVVAPKKYLYPVCKRTEIPDDQRSRLIPPPYRRDTVGKLSDLKTKLA